MWSVRNCHLKADHQALHRPGVVLCLDLNADLDLTILLTKRKVRPDELSKIRRRPPLRFVLVPQFR
jgi:hypothetical protein